jgi:hypothetical protein
MISHVLSHKTDIPTPKALKPRKVAVAMHAKKTNLPNTATHERSVDLPAKGNSYPFAKRVI